MSGFEAIFGLAASGAGLLSLSLQLGESASKLRCFYQATKNAPRIVSRLIFDLETMALALRELEANRDQQSDDGSVLARCIFACQRNVAEIQQIVNKMDRRLEKNSKVRGRVYAVFKEKEIQEMLDDLERAKSSLEFGYMMHVEEERKRQDQMCRNILLKQEGMLESLSDRVMQGNLQTSN